MTVTIEDTGRYVSGYKFQELGACRVGSSVKFRAWLPFANDVKLVLFNENGQETLHQMTREGASDYFSTLVSDAAEGQQYLYRIDGRDKSDPRAKQMVHSAGNSILRLRDYPWKVNDFQMAPWSELVIYQMHCGSFPDKTVQDERLIEDVIDELFYLQKLGVNAIELLPTSEFPRDRSFGYDTAALYAVESKYGGPIALKQLVDAAHARGIAVILDVVYNHISPDYNDPETGNMSIWRMTPGWDPRLPDGSAGGGVYFYNDWRWPTGFGHRPDYGRQEVRDFLRDNAMMWLLEFRVDGLRFDSVANIRNVYGNDPQLKAAYDIDRGWWLLQEINYCVSCEYERRNLITIAEDLKDNEWVTKDTNAGGAGFGSQWNDTYMYTVRDALTATEDRFRNMDRLRDVLYQRYNTDAFERIVTSESHDAASVLHKDEGKKRLTEAIDPGHVDDSWYVRKRTGLGAAMVLTSPGIPMVLQGQELLEWRWMGDRRNDECGVDWNRFCNVNEDCRTCMNRHGKCRTATGAPCDKTIDCSECPELPERCEPEGPFKGIFMQYRDLIHLRRNWFNNTRGLRGQHINVFHVNNADKLIAYHRWEHGGAGDDVVVVLNFADRSYDNYTIGLPRGGQWQVRFNSDSGLYGPMFGNFFSYGTEATPAEMDGLHFKADIGIGRYSAIILSQ